MWLDQAIGQELGLLMYHGSGTVSFTGIDVLGACEITENTCMALCPWPFPKGKSTRSIFCSGIWSFIPVPDTGKLKPLLFPR